ncbi:hypothetical protein FRC12_009086 [Ceratobasidium sp. 428]|nr:hypothetical protein FRC12_009086 [Ceratobasidium sp. 428]
MNTGAGLSSMTLARSNKMNSQELSTMLYAQISMVVELSQLLLHVWAIVSAPPLCSGVRKADMFKLAKKEAANMGIYIYRLLDLQRGLFSRTKISNASAGRLAVADFRCSGTWDIGAISYSVPNYLETDNPSMRVLCNNTPQTRHAIKAQKLGDEVMIRVPRAALATHISEMPFLDIGGKRLSIVVVPPNKEYQLSEPPKFQGKEYPKDGVKVINGEISWNEGGNRITRGIAVEAQKAKSMIPDAENNIVKAGPNGAIFVRLASSPITTLPDLKFEDMDDVATINNLPFSVDPAVRDMLFPWVRCSDREWGQGGTYYIILNMDKSQLFLI